MVGAGEGTVGPVSDAGSAGGALDSSRLYALRVCHVDVREALAGNVSAPPEVLVTLAGSPVKGVRAAVARNASTPPEVLASLALDGEAVVRRAVVGNPVAADEVKEAAALLG